MLARVLFWVLLPCVIPQALWVRLRAPRFAAARGPQHGTVGEGARLQLLALGDSIVAGVGVETTDQALGAVTAGWLAQDLGRTVSWYARGRSGATAVTLRETLLPMIPDEPIDIVVLSVGVNDVTSLARTSRWRANLTTLLDRLQERLPDALIVLAGVPPLWGFPLLPQPLRALFGMRARSFDQVGQEVAGARPSVIHVSLDFEPTPEQFSADGYHPSAASYNTFGRVMAAAARRYLEQHRGA